MSVIVRLHVAWSVVQDSDTLVVSSPLFPRRVRVANPSTQVREACQALRRGVSLDTVRNATSDDVAATVRALDEVGALVRRTSDDDVLALTGADLYDRQIRFMSYYETSELSGLKINRRLQSSTVLVVGLGGLGGWIALLCARMGIKDIIGIDPDSVELSNLHRQVLYGRSDIGRTKAEAASRTLLCADPTVRFTGHARWINVPEDLEPYLDGVDLVINPFPYLPSMAGVARATATAALRAGVPSLNMPMAHGVGPLTVPGQTACIECAWPSLQRRFQIDASNAVTAPVWSDGGFLAALAPRQAISGGLGVWEAAQFLSGMSRPRTLDGTAFIDIVRYGEHAFLEIARNPDCALCGGFA